MDGHIFTTASDRASAWRKAKEKSQRERDQGRGVLSRLLELLSSHLAFLPFLPSLLPSLFSFEYAQKLLHYLPQLDRAGVSVVAVGIGSVAAAKEFATLVGGFPLGT